MLTWLRGLAADIARLIALAHERRADRLIARARAENAAAEWWSDAQALCDGLDSWASLRGKREHRLALHGRAR